ncbi:MAG: methylated-DNA--[protein]-cysteine S-methyltransferase [Verrucomicrobia bacterium]|nr:methylated-DNA--[protein]-cysteine S-methyltransferase [Verrucomicrobiota bacterium]
MESPSPPPDAIESAAIETNDGVFTAYFSERGLRRLDFPPRFHPGKHRASPNKPSSRYSPWIATLKSALNEALQAKAPSRLPPLDLQAGTAFQQSVWRALQRIPPKKTMTYGEVAQAIGRPKATRAVGQACGANPIPVLIPCHRVVAAHGAIGGFSCGLELKRMLLEREGIRF